ncbi:AlpA family transcriptional regulator [Oxalobacteraceae bacterium OTU3CINTB1]|nr:AlpA family transcriptional regulator [Oxalobacteraceae bacterium OTU3CINTB1]
MTTTSSLPPLRIIRRKQLEERTGLSRSAIYDRLSSNSPRFDPSFPRAIKLGANSVGWVESEIEAWLLSRMQMNRV